MTIPLTERAFLPAAVITPTMLDAFGQTAYVPGPGGSPGFTLVSFTSDPLRDSCRSDFVLFCHEEADDFVWTFGDPVTQLMIKQVRGDTVAWARPEEPGTLKTSVSVKKGGKEIAYITLQQTVAGPGPQVIQLFDAILNEGAGKKDIVTLREVCEELKAYIEVAAAATGANGIPARLLAAVLFREISNRPRDGSPAADALREQLQGKDYDARQQAIVEKIVKFTGRKVQVPHIHDIREVELELIRGFFNEYEGLAPLDPRRLTLANIGPKSLGVGQIQQSTVAMVLGLIPWREDMVDINEDYNSLLLTKRLEIFTRLRFPKSNIGIAAKLLAMLKNRSHRFPALTPKQMLSDEKALAIVAHEYQNGPRSTANNDVSISKYGDAVMHNSHTAYDQLGLKLFFPDPP